MQVCLLRASYKSLFCQVTIPKTELPQQFPLSILQYLHFQIY